MLTDGLQYERTNGWKTGSLYCAMTEAGTTKSYQTLIFTSTVYIAYKNELHNKGLLLYWVVLTPKGTLPYRCAASADLKRKKKSQKDQDI